MIKTAQDYKAAIVDRVDELIQYCDDYVESLTEERDELEKKLKVAKQKLEMMISKYE